MSGLLQETNRMTLSNRGIKDWMEKTELEIYRQSGSGLSIEPSSIDLHLSRYVGTTNHTETVAVWDESTYPEWEVREDDFPVVPPNGFMLAETDEVVELPPAAVGLLHGRSSVGRLGLFIHNAGLVDAGFSGSLTLELFNPAPYPICLISGMRICQMTIHPHSSRPDVPYSARNGNKYQGQLGPTPSRLFEDFEGMEVTL